MFPSTDTSKGKPPFLGGTVTEVLYKHMTEAPPDLRKLRPEAPEGVVAVLEKALAKDQDERWGNIRDAMRAL